MHRQTRSSSRNQTLSTSVSSPSSSSNTPPPSRDGPDGPDESDPKPGPSSRKSLQLDLLFGLKRHIDLMYKQVNLQKACIKNVNKFQKFLQKNVPTAAAAAAASGGGGGNGGFLNRKLSQQHEKFDRDYRYCRKKLLAKKWKRNSLTDKGGVGTIYDTIDDLLKNFLSNDGTGNNSIRTRLLSESGYGSESDTVNETNTTENDNENDLVFFVCPTNGCDEIFNDKEEFDEHLKQQHRSNNDELIDDLMLPSSPATTSDTVKPEEEEEGEESVEDKQKREKRLKMKNRKKERIQQNRLLKEKQKYMQWKIESIILKKKAALENMKKYSETLQCSFSDCDYVAKYPTLMIMHLKTFHDQQPLECSDCFEAFPNEQLLSKHRQSIHETNQTESTSSPSSSSSSGNQLKTTKKQQQQKCRRKCNWPNCGYSCNLLSNLRKHRTLKHPKQTKSNVRKVNNNNNKSNMKKEEEEETMEQN